MARKRTSIETIGRIKLRTRAKFVVSAFTLACTYGEWTYRETQSCPVSIATRLEQQSTFASRDVDGHLGQETGIGITVRIERLFTVP